MRPAPTLPEPPRPRVAGGLVLLCAVALAAGAAAPAKPKAPPQAKHVPALVFVSRQPATGVDAGQVPGTGPRGRTLEPGGRLLVRDANGKVRELVPATRFHDVSDPAVSWDGTTVAFAAVEHPGEAWRIWSVGTDGSGLLAVTHSDRALDLAPLGGDPAGRFARYDDFDPVFLPDGRIAFASTRFPLRAQQGGGLASNLFVVSRGGPP